MDFAIPRYAQETKHLKTEHPCIDVPIKGFFKHLEIDTLIQQGFSGATALDNVMRRCMGNEPGSTLHVCVPYSKLRLEIIQKTVVVSSQVFLPGSMTLFIEPMKEGQFLRVRVLRFIVTPSTCDEQGRVSKRKKTHSPPNKTSIKVDSITTEDSDVSDNVPDDEQPDCSHYDKLSGRSRSNQLSESFSFRPHISTTLRQRIL
jgi:hypothetical protein